MDRLSARQLQVVDLRCRLSRTTVEIARELHIQPQTLKNHITAILVRLEKRTMADCCYTYGRELGEGFDPKAMRSRDV